MNTRLLGTICILGSFAVLAEGFRPSGMGAAEAQFGDRFTALSYAIFGIGGICGIAGLIQLNALGPKTTARAMGFLPMIGFAAFILGDGLRAAGLLTADTPIIIFAAIGWIAMLAGMLVVGILTIAAKAWRGWRRFVPLLTIVMLPVGFGIGALSGNQTIGGVLFFASWVLLGVVVATAEPTSTLRQVTA
ncbi:MAG: hypothetical protein M3R24_29170 [Chloroflexota bacterium]|nr:hypothetical protein [Chloroflexota bacterium]